MPIIRKLTTVGDARGITLPKSWIDHIEKTTGVKIREIALEVDGVIVIRPVLEPVKKSEKQSS